MSFLANETVTDLSPNLISKDNEERSASRIKKVERTTRAGGGREGRETRAHLETNVPSLESAASSSFADLIQAFTSEPYTRQGRAELLKRGE